MDFRQIEEDAVAAVRKVIADAREHEPAIEDAAIEALGAVGAPPVVATAVGGMLAALLNHFASQQRPSEDDATPLPDAHTPDRPEDPPPAATQVAVDTSAWAKPTTGPASEAAPPTSS